MSDSDEIIERIQRAWAGITALMKHTNAEMFQSKAMTREIIQKGEYLDFLRDHWHRLREWLHIFENMDGGGSSTSRSHTRIILTKSSATSFSDTSNDRVRICA